MYLLRRWRALRELRRRIARRIARRRIARRAPVHRARGAQDDEQAGGDGDRPAAAAEVGAREVGEFGRAENMAFWPMFSRVPTF